MCDQQVEHKPAGEDRADGDPFQGRKDLQQQGPQPVDRAGAFNGQVSVEAAEDWAVGAHRSHEVKMSVSVT
ncbi:hypothetical protein [Arthrobacter sp. H20]|uniref:hypothetical protein n=1 Tax=Arthrobacter sp. H20 TaxID=1267981 RepID=UPI0004BC716A|nr:hypothetical protein [Arthrobacter sp. H20]